MTCAEARGAFSRYHDGALPAADSSALGAHLAACRACGLEWEGYRRAMRVLASVAPPPEPVGLSARVEGAWRSAPAARDWWQFVVMAAVFLVGLVIGLLMMRGWRAW